MRSSILNRAALALVLLLALGAQARAQPAAETVATCNARVAPASPWTQDMAARARAIYDLTLAARLDEALAQAREAVAQYPADAMLETMLFEVYYRRGEMTPAVAAINLALKLDPCNDRAHFDAWKFFELSGVHRKAMQQLDFAHQLKPHSDYVDATWAAQTAPHPASCTLAPDAPSSARVSLLPRAGSASLDYGADLNVKLNGISTRLILDSADPGITIGAAEAKRLGIAPEQTYTSAPHAATGSSAVTTYTSTLKTLQVGPLTFENCQISVVVDPPVTHGGIGIEPFSTFLITLDARHRRLSLDPLPPLPAGSPAAGPQDRYVAPSMRTWLHFYHPSTLRRILIPATLGTAGTHLFILDTGAGQSHIDPGAAREVTEVTRDLDTPISGYGGVEHDVFRAERVEIALGGYSRAYHSMLSLSRATKSVAAGVRVSGILGFDWARDAVIRVDYRDQLIDIAPNPH